jgi:hypothetical protein
MPDRFKKRGELPRKTIAVYPMHTQRRISTQRSCFTIHGRDAQALDRLHNRGWPYLAKIVIPAWSVQAIKREVDSAGIDEATIFPDLNGLSKTIAARWKPDGHQVPHQRVYTRLRPSPIHGVGVFAIMPIQKGTLLFHGDNQEMLWVHKKSVPRRDGEIRKLYSDFAVITDDEERYGCPQTFNRLTPSWYLNEADPPKTANVHCDPETYEFRAAKDIKPGDELTVAYDTYSARPPAARRNGKLDSRPRTKK